MLALYACNLSFILLGLELCVLIIIIFYSWLAGGLIIPFYFFYLFLFFC